jgi:hypothetical protein
MPERSEKSRQLIPFAMLVSAITLFVAAYLLQAGIVPLPEQTRPVAVGVVVAAGIVDVIIGIWFFSKGQSS